MAIQQINLYLDEFRKKKEVLNAAILQKYLLVLVLLLSGLYFYDYWQLVQSKQQLIQLEKDKVAAEQRLAELQKTHPPIPRNPRLVSDIEKYQQWVALRQEAVNALSEKQFGNTSGFAGYFVGLARKRTTGLWLTGLSLEAGGAKISMQGSALKPELVPQFLQQLSTENVFTGTRFKSFVLNREKEKNRHVDFSLKNELDQEGGA